MNVTTLKRYHAILYIQQQTLQLILLIRLRLQGSKRICRTRTRSDPGQIYEQQKYYNAGTRLLSCASEKIAWWMGV